MATTQILDNDGVPMTVLPEVEITDTRLPLFTFRELLAAIALGIVSHFVIKSLKL